MPLPPLPPSAVTVQARASDWRDAVRQTGLALAASGAARPDYADEMIRMIEQYGPYVVIAPGLALAHARPGPEVLAGGLAVVTLATPVAFGHPHNDPVSVVLGLAATSGSSHLEQVAEIANVFNDASAIPAIAAARDADAVIRIMSGRADLEPGPYEGSGDDGSHGGASHDEASGDGVSSDGAANDGEEGRT